MTQPSARAAAVAALTYPGLLLVGVVLLWPDRSGDVTELAKAALAVLLLVVAAPTAWLLIPWNVPVSIVLGVGLPSGLVAWAWFGSWLRNVGTWRRWRRFYAGAALGWTGMCMFGFVVLTRLG